MVVPWLSKSKWDPRGKVDIYAHSVGMRSTWFKHCYVTGGSAGLGLALAIELTKRGAHVSIVARNKDRLQTALGAMEVGYYNSLYQNTIVKTRRKSVKLPSRC